jgi:hypothetical protein
MILLFSMCSSKAASDVHCDNSIECECNGSITIKRERERETDRKILNYEYALYQDLILFH